MLLVVDNDIPTSDSRSLPCEENLIHKIQELFNLLRYVTVNNTMSCSPLFSLGTTQNIKPQGENGVEDTDSPNNSAGND